MALVGWSSWKGAILLKSKSKIKRLGANPRIVAAKFFVKEGKGSDLSSYRGFFQPYGMSGNEQYNYR